MVLARAFAGYAAEEELRDGYTSYLVVDYRLRFSSYQKGELTPAAARSRSWLQVAFDKGKVSKRFFCDATWCFFWPTFPTSDEPEQLTKLQFNDWALDLLLQVLQSRRYCEVAAWPKVGQPGLDTKTRWNTIRFPSHPIGR